MYKIVYAIRFFDTNGMMRFTPDYTVWFQQTDPSGLSYFQMEALGRRSFHQKNPECEVITIEVVSKGYC